jgi:hypothetical protein
LMIRADILAHAAPINEVVLSIVVKAYRQK